MKLSLNLLILIVVTLLTACSTTPKVHAMVDEIAILNTLSDNGCDVAEFNQNVRRGQLQVKCKGPFIDR